ncbi:MAG: hypothetical protein LUG65_06115 [Clostridiales bacterium]|nr:hypothetical protein [Clostridiales bacterium]
MFEDKERIRNIICIVLAVVTAVAIGIFAYLSNRTEREYTNALQSAVDEARPYEVELQTLQQELEETEAFSWSSDTAKIMIGYSIVQGIDIEFVSTQAEAYGFEPVLILDCSQGFNTLAYLIYMASGTNWEVMLTASDFSDQAIADTPELRAYLERYELQDTGVFLFMDGDDSEENIQCLMDNDFTGYAVQNTEALSSGYTKDGLVYFDYAYVQTGSELSADGMDALFEDNASMLITFDMSSIHAETLSEQEVTDILDTLQTLSEEGYFLFSSVSDVVDEMVELGALQEIYDENILQKQERIAELETIIEKIYNRENFG